MAHIQQCVPFKKLFGRHLDEFWGREERSLDGVMRRAPCNVKGFDYEVFCRTLKLKVDSRLPLESLRKPLLRAVKAKYGEDGQQVIAGLLVPAKGLKMHKRKKPAQIDG